MLTKLTLRNAKRSVTDYTIYVVTMVLIASLMFAFDAMVFSKDLRALYSEASLFMVFIGIASFFIIIILIWMVHYMVHFMLAKRSREFGIYLLLGMKKKQIASLFRRENMLLGLFSLVLGVLPGILLQIAFINVFYSFMETPYRISLDLSPWTYLMTVGLYALAYVLALLRVGHKFQNMTINSLIHMDRQNEKVQTKNSSHKGVLTILSVAYIIFFNYMLLAKKFTAGNAKLMIIVLILSVYLLYMGLSSLLADYIQKRRKGVYKDCNLFVLRQLSSKVKTMRFTMGTMTILFTTALLAWMCVMMFTDYQKNQFEKTMPYDVIVMKEDVAADFQKEIEAVERGNAIEDSLIYNIYHNKSNVINQFLEERVDGVYEDKEYNTATYYQYDTFIGISDYNQLRTMAGYQGITLEEGNYLIHCIDRVNSFMETLATEHKIAFGTDAAILQKIYSEPLSQKGLNGADYLIVVSDEALTGLTPYYSAFAAQIKGEGTKELSNELLDLHPNYDKSQEEYVYTMRVGGGSDSLFSYSDSNVVKDSVKKDFIFQIVTLDFVLAYIGFVFLCAALTILAVQQLSDSSKYKYRYKILRQLGVGRGRMNRIVLKQLGTYYICPFIISILISLVVGMYSSERFVYYTGVQTQIFLYYILAVLVLSAIYAVYILVTFVSFMRNIQN